MGAGEGQHRGGEQRTPPGLRHPVSPPPVGGPPGEAHGGRQPGPGFNQPGGPARMPPAAEHSPSQPQHGNKKPEKGTPPPKPQ
jgi:hypothetical protein